jgi:hypothetical protein
MAWNQVSPNGLWWWLQMEDQQLALLPIRRRSGVENLSLVLHAYKSARLPITYTQILT